jgi:hypothetical protein
MTPSLIHRLRSALLACCLAAMPLLAAAQSFQVRIDTTPLAGRTGFMAFDLVAGSSGVPNSVTIDSFSSTGTLGAAALSGNASGTLAGTVTLVSSTFFSEYLQPVVFAAGLTTFRLDLGTLYTDGTIPDAFALFLLDDVQAPFETSDPTGAHALLAADLVAAPSPTVFSSTWATASLVPEPATAALWLLGLGALAGWRLRAPACQAIKTA